MDPQVLIDTWWNVKLLLTILQRNIHTCFNRYMVECELKKTMAESKELGVLIDTWWNVNVVLLDPLTTVPGF